MSSPVLLTVAGTIPDDVRAAIAAGRRPRVDYLELAEALDADVVDHAAARRDAGRFARLVGRVAGDDVLLAFTCFRRRRGYRVVFTDSERVGFPFAALCRLGKWSGRHVMIGHRLSPPKKIMAHRLLGLRRRIDQILVYSSAQRDVAVERLGYPASRVTVTTFMVDSRFWTRSAPADGHRRRLICAVGQELRDYPTLVEAVRGLDVDVVLAAGSPWSRRRDTTAGIDLPPNVTVTQLDQAALRGLYDEAQIVVVPLEPTDFQAGITTILEAMAMGLPVICTRTVGQIDTIIEGENGRYVPPGDVGELRRTIVELLDDPQQRERLGAAAHDWVMRHADLDVYVARLADAARATDRADD